ncbi:hypothetical protein [Spirosoma luteolum]
MNRSAPLSWSARTARPTHPPGRWRWGAVLLVAGLVAALAIPLIGDFRHPLSDGTDTDQYEYVGYVFGKNLHLWPWPQLTLHNNQTFYPYGLTQVFLDWGFERDYWYALCYRLHGGPGPYLQWYYLYTLIVSAGGTVALLQSRFGVVRAGLLALGVSVMNAYAVWKFPVHMNVCIDHWTVLCMLATFRLLLDVADRRPLSLVFVGVWVWLHVQVLSQELAYVAGFALTFTTLALPVLGWGLWRWWHDTELIPIAGVPVATSAGATGPSAQLAQLRAGLADRRLWLVGGAIGLSLWLYLPLTIQIATTAWSFDFAEVPTAPQWSHPARLVIPYLPGLHTFDRDYGPWLRDVYESFGQGSPGLAVLLLAGWGWWQHRQRVAVWSPVVLMLVLCLLYHPVLVPTLKVFPWFTYNRHGGRASLVYPVLLGVLALGVRRPRHTLGRVGLTALLVLLVSEWQTAYGLRRIVPVSVVSPDVVRFCAVVRAQPGEAVLDFPFCTVGADGVGKKQGLCPYYDQNAVFTFRRFYDKSGVGQYLGRLHPDQIQPFLRDGWPRLLTPGRVFTETDWQFLDRFLRQNRFAGINLYPDYLTPDQTRQFYRRYGPPIAQTRFPVAGRVVFIPLGGKPLGGIPPAGTPLWQEQPATN